MKKKKYRSLQEREKIIKNINQLLDDGYTKQEACAKNKIHVSMLYKWQRDAKTKVVIHQSDQPKRKYSKRKPQSNSKVAIVMCNASDVADVLANL